MVDFFVQMKRFSFLLGFCVLLGTGQAAAAVCQRADVVVYGGTPGGITAAIQAARLKKSVILLEPTAHIGGMMSNGLTKTDASPRKNVYGGITAEFLAKAKAHYGTSDPIRIYFESKWAESRLTPCWPRQRSRWSSSSDC